MYIKNILKKENFYIDTKATIKQTLNKMNINRDGFIVFVDNSKVKGILTERDIIKIVLEKGLDRKENAFKYATKDIITYNQKRTCEYVLFSMIEHNIRRVVVVDDEDNFIGVTSHEYLINYINKDRYKIKLKICDIEDLHKIISLEKDYNVLEAFKIMKQNNIGSIVVTDKKSPVGIITERDFIKILNSDTSLNTTIKVVMSSPLIYIDSKESIENAINMLNKYHIQRLVVKDKNDYKIISIRDITRFLKGNYALLVEKQLRHSKDILDSIDEMVIETILLENEYIVEWCNKRAIELFGYGILDKKITNIISNDVWEKILNSKKDKFNLEFETQNKIFKLSITKIVEDNYKKIRLVFSDITEVKQILEDLYQNEKLSSINSLLGNIAHHWRQPLSVIASLASGIILKKEYNILDDKYLINSCEEINSNAQYLSNIINDFSRFLKKNDGFLNFNLIDLLNEVKDIFKPILNQNNVVFIEDIKNNHKRR